jgi:hypothetical protein
MTGAPVRYKVLLKRVRLCIAVRRPLARMRVWQPL